MKKKLTESLSAMAQFNPQKITNSETKTVEKKLKSSDMTNGSKI